MSYILGQYNKNRGVNDNAFMTLITSGTALRKAFNEDSGVSGITNIFEDEYVKVSALLNTNHYYFHGKIKRLNTEQTFNIKLVNDTTSGSETENVDQYIKTIKVAPKGSGLSEWADVEFIFTPIITFDSILFELQRTIADYTSPRQPIIFYEELSIINNIIPTQIKDGVKLIKLGVQSRPNLLMCIEGEEIRTCRTGIYELKNGIITINFFSVCHAIAEGSGSTMEQDMETATISQCYFGSDKANREIDSFTLDYMYRE